MKVSTVVATTHNVKLDLEERFTTLIADGRVVSVDAIEAHQDASGEEWKLVMFGNRILKSGEFGKRVRVGTWEHTHAFTEAAHRALWATLPDNVRGSLALLGVQI